MSKKKLGLKIPTKNELLKKYGDMIISANETRESGLWLPSTFFALNHTFGGGIPYGKILEIAGEESSGKALTLDTPILTEQGWKPMGELTLTDKVMDPVSGHSVDIMGIFPQGEKDIYKVTFNDGTSIKCSKDHLWEVQYKVRTETKTEVLSLAQIMNNDIDGKKKKKVSFRFSIPNPTPIRYAANKELPVPPYVLGCILSNVADIGYQNKVVTKLDEFHEVFNMVYFERRLGITISDLGLYVVHENDVPVMRHLFIINDFTSQLASIGVSNEHRAIPRMYLEAPVKDRKILLAGLLDIKGEVTKIGFSYTGNTELVTTMLELIRSLGGWAKITGSEGDTTTIEARMPHFEPFVHKFKREEFRVSTDFECMKKIEKIEYVGKEECQCIKVNSERGLFIANDYIVTHNTLMAYNFAYSCQQLGGSVIWVDAEQSWMNSWARENGVDPDKVTLINDTRIEYIADAVADIALYLRSQLTHNEPILLVVDSIAAIDCTDNVDSNLVGAKAEMGGRAKALYKYFRVRNEFFYKLGITQIYINQLRTALNVGFGKDNSCLHYQTMIPFVDGTSMSIGEIIKNRVSKEVWSYNEKTHRFEPKPIVGWVVKEETDDWYQFKTTGPETYNGFNGFTCTGTHHCLTDSGWKKAKDITLKDKLITKQRRVINGTLRDFLWGTIIADASLYTKNGRETTRLSFSNSSQPEYLKWKVDKLSKAFPMRNKGGRAWRYSTIQGYTELEEIRKLIQVDKSGRGQRDPLKLWGDERLSDLSLALWYMDDGHKYNRVTVGIGISPSRTNLAKLSEYLIKQGLDNKPYDKGIKFTNKGSQILMGRIARYVIPPMQYKLLDGYQGQYQDFELTYTEYYIPREVDILSISHEFDTHNRRFRKPYLRKKYDITIPDNHNFLAGSVEQGVVVHNTTTGGAALKFYASIRAAFYSGKTLTMKIKGNERKVGKLVTIRLIKNKVAPPRPTISKCPVYFNPKYHEIGFDRCYALDDALVELDVLEKTTGGFKYEGKNIARGEDSLRELLNEDAGIRRKLLKASGINTISATRKKMESIQENLYPVEEGMEYESFSESDDDEEEVV